MNFGSLSKPGVRRSNVSPCSPVRIGFLAAFCLLALSEPAHAYIGPGAGFAVMGGALVMFTAIIAGILALLTWPFRYVIRSIRYRRALGRSLIKRFVVLGLDGLDPVMCNKFLSENKLPNFAKLAQQGCFKELGTSLPPLSPVAWSCFQTGVNPGKHNIFDFLTRSKQTYLPELSSVDIRPGRRKGKADIRLLRKGKPFWHVLGENGIFSNILRVPITFPPEKFRGVLLSAMCVPDLRGSQGTFSYYSSRSEGDGEYTGGQRFKVEYTNGVAAGELLGPPNPIKPGDMTCPFTVSTNGKKGPSLRVNGKTYPLKPGHHSEWIKVEFKAGRRTKVRGICQFLLLKTEPDFELYVTPINIDPEKPAMPIAYPNVYSTYLAKRQGTFATLGLAEDTWGLTAGILSDKQFLEQVDQADVERKKMFFDALNKVKRGLVVVVFDGTDRIQHMFWRYTDEKHPGFDGNTKDPQRDAIEELYVRMDKMLGEVMKKCDDPDTVLCVISDHGHKTFRYGIDLNRWLLDNGYLVLKPGKEDDYKDAKYLSAVDFSKTRAYASGLAGMYLNIKGRESQGIVEPGAEADALREEIGAKLAQLVDVATGKSAIKQVYNSLKAYTGPYKNEAPDLIVGYNEGYRVCWEAAIGQLTDKVFHPNEKPWSADHCIDQSLVPGVLFCNRPVGEENPRLMDIGATALEMFGVDIPKYMDGRSIRIADSQSEEA